MYVLIPRSTLSFEKPIIFDLYVKLNGRMVKVLKEGEIPDAARIDNYLSKKDDVLYIESETIERFMDDRFAAMFAEMTGHGSIEKKLKAFIRGLELCYLDLKLVRPHADKFMRLFMVIDSSYEFFRHQDVQGILLKFMMNMVESPVSRRALIAASMSSALFFNSNDCPPRIFRSIFGGGVLRDLSLSLVDGEDPHYMNLTDKPELQEQFYTHPARTVELLRSYRIADDTMEAMILQHHEEPTGLGFQVGLKRAEIFKPAHNLNLSDWLMGLVAESTNAKGVLDRELVIEKLHSQLPEENRRHLAILNKVMCTTLGVANSALTG